MTPLAPAAAAECEQHFQIWPTLNKRKVAALISKMLGYTQPIFPLSILFSFPRSSFSFVSQDTTCLAQMPPACEALLSGIKLLACDREAEEQFAASFHISYLITRGAKKV